MNTQPDFEDFLRLLEVHRAEYMIVGGFAVAYHGFPRFTKDIDNFFSTPPKIFSASRRCSWPSVFKLPRYPLKR